MQQPSRKGSASSKTNMEKKEENREKKTQNSESAKESSSTEELLPMDSPYVKYKDLEDYKRKGYGTEGHQEPKPGRGAGATDAPTPSGAAVSSEAELSATEAVNRQGVP
ncbi:hypothetical protein HN51_006683 [Arachis hypogaea]|uniref:Late embryogenesis abundant protein group 8 protein n=3 Tax=Arachis hypogaea TaxID=3818 RepID=A0A444WTW9_ARAHY|nr:Late embryogenesis abundant protein group 8 protein [Arachis hypogaea]RYQ80840.1 hypothetical protein Ahy_Scaffold1g106971 isoform D [Arachis hypogaea]